MNCWNRFPKSALTASSLSDKLGIKNLQLCKKKKKSDSYMSKVPSLGGRNIGVSEELLVTNVYCVS